MAQRMAAAFGFMGVALGAFGAHGLKDRLLANETLATWETAVLYHLIHAVVLLVLTNRHSIQRGTFLCFASGIVVFSGTLYILSITGIKWLGAITPIGGVLLLIGWARLFFEKKKEVK